MHVLLLRKIKRINKEKSRKFILGCGGRGG